MIKTHRIYYKDIDGVDEIDVNTSHVKYLQFGRTNYVMLKIDEEGNREFQGFNVQTTKKIAQIKAAQFGCFVREIIYIKDLSNNNIIDFEAVN